MDCRMVRILVFFNVQQKKAGPQPGFRLFFTGFAIEFPEVIYSSARKGGTAGPSGNPERIFSVGEKG